MSYSPNSNIITINKHNENQILNGITRLKSIQNENNNPIKKGSLNNIALNLQNFISNALVNNASDTKYFNINEELEEIEKVKKNQMKEKESFHRLMTKYPLKEQLFSINYDENTLNNNNLIGINNFKQKQKLSTLTIQNPFNLIYGQNPNSPMSCKNKFRHTVDPHDNFNDQIRKYKNKNLNTSLFKEQKTFSNHNNSFVLSSPSRTKNRFSQSQIFSKTLGDENNEKLSIFKIKNKTQTQSTKKLSHNFIGTKKIKNENFKNNILFRNQKREKSQVINKDLLYYNLQRLYQTDPKKLLTFTTLSKDTQSHKTLKTYEPNNKDELHSQIHLSNSPEKEINKKKNIYKDDNDIRNYFNLSSSQYNHFSKCCDEIKDRLLISPKPKNTKKSKDSSIISLKSLHENINNNNKINNNEESLINLVEKKDYSEERMNNNIENKLNLNELKEMYYRHLIRQNKLVYDSLSDNESDDDDDYSFYVDPKSNFKFYFDLMIFLLTLYNVIVPPLMMGFYPFQDHILYQSYLVVNIFGDVFYLIDLILGFITAYFDIEEHFITKKSLITINYLMSWFIIDLISSIPYTTIFTIFNFIQKHYYKNLKQKYNLIELVQLLPIVKNLKIYKNNEFYNKFKRFLYHYTILYKWFNTANFLFLFFIYTHILACIFVFLSYLENPSWISNQNLIDSSKGEIYIASFYYVFATVFTVGYGDIVSVNIYERVFNLILLIVGIVAYSFSISTLINYVQNEDHKTKDYNSKMDILNQIKVTHEKMPKSLYDKIARFLYYRLKHVERDKNEIIDNLPIGLRTKLIMEMYKPIIENFIFFKTYSKSDFVLRVILAFRPIFSIKNEKLVNEGDYLEEIIFVKRGLLSLELPLPILFDKKELEDINLKQRRNSLIDLEFPYNPELFLNDNKTIDKPKIIDVNHDLLPHKTMTFVRGKGLRNINKNNKKKSTKLNQQYVKIIEIRKNEHFGDILMFLNRRSPLSMKVKSKTAELFLLNKTDAVEISMSFPQIWEQIIKKSLFNMEQIDRLINKTLRFFFNQNDSKSKKEFYYQKDITKNNIYVNCKDLYTSLSFEDCELKTIPTVTEIEKESSIHTKKNKKKKKIKRANKILLFSKSSDSDTQTITSNDLDSKTKRSISSSNNSKRNNQNLHHIEEENSDEEKDSLLKRLKKKNFFENTERENISAKKPTEGSKDYSDSSSLYFNSSSSEYKNYTESKTHKTNEENNFFDCSNFSVNDNNTIVYPYVKEEINNEQFPFENNNLILNNNNDICLNGIVPKDPFFNIYGKPRKINNNFEVKQLKKKSNFSILSISNFNIQINSNSNKIYNSQIIIYQNLNKKIELKIIKNESFTIIDSPKVNKSFSTQNVKKFNILSSKLTKESKDKKEINTIYNSNPNTLMAINQKISEKQLKKSTEKRLSKLILQPTVPYFSNKNGENQNEVNKNMNLFSSGKLTLIGKNITNSSLALNNPKMFYINYFNKVVSNRDYSNDNKNSVSSRLKEIGKIIYKGQMSKRQTNILDFNDLKIIEKNQEKDNMEKL